MFEFLDRYVLKVDTFMSIQGRYEGTREAG